jgi:hypothetical protein
MPQYHPPGPRTSRRPCYRASSHQPSVPRAAAAGGAAFLLPTKHPPRWIGAAQVLYSTWLVGHLAPSDPRRTPTLRRLHRFMGEQP